mmetsp:Transcript_38044/g.122324  ORF Transcript_38044/g.122324 Transcript_38044/m.122324 type:complete len:224 (-) Transcript_38044:625-1296(-)
MGRRRHRGHDRRVGRRLGLRLDGAVGRPQPRSSRSLPSGDANHGLELGSVVRVRHPRLAPPDDHPGLPHGARAQDVGPGGLWGGGCTPRTRRAPRGGNRQTRAQLLVLRKLQDGLPAHASRATGVRPLPRGGACQLPPAQTAADGRGVQPMAPGTNRRLGHVQLGADQRAARTGAREELFAPDQRRLCVGRRHAHRAAGAQSGVRPAAVDPLGRGYPSPPAPH